MSNARHVGWIREIPDKRQVIYVGDYSTCSAPGSPETCAKVVFPLPNGTPSSAAQPERNSPSIVP